MLAGRRVPWRLLAAAGLVGLALAAWLGGGIGSLAVPGALADLLDGLRAPYGPLLMVGLYVAGGLVSFPVLVLIAATAMLYGPLLGFATALTGVLASATLLFWLGRRLGRAGLERYAGPAIRRVNRRLGEGRGVVALAVVRTVPLAPFSIVNLVAGASRMGFRDYLAGTVAGMLPALLAFSLLGDQLLRTLSRPSLGGVALLLALAAAAALLGTLATRLLRRRLGGEEALGVTEAG